MTIVLRLFFFICGSLTFIASSSLSFSHLRFGILRRERVTRLFAENDALFSTSVYDTIGEGRIAIIPGFLPKEEMMKVKEDAAILYNQNKFSTDGKFGHGCESCFSSLSIVLLYLNALESPCFLRNEWEF
jgi:hypothetical protein